jgi:hypothetical protein
MRASLVLTIIGDDKRGHLDDPDLSNALRCSG